MKLYLTPWSIKGILSVYCLLVIVNKLSVGSTSLESHVCLNLCFALFGSVVPVIFPRGEIPLGGVVVYITLPRPCHKQIRESAVSPSFLQLSTLQKN